MHKFKMLKLPNVSESTSPIFNKRKRYTNVLFHKMFFPKNGGVPGGPTQAQSACPHFLEKNIFIEKSFCEPFASVKKCVCRFLRRLACHNLNLCVSEHFQVVKRFNLCHVNFHSFQKSGSVFIFARAFFCKKLFVSRSILSCGNIKDLLEATPT